jgi:UDP-N-acetylmuramoylalanine--D-glutamate ligase
MGAALDSDLIARNDTPVILGLGATGLSIARYFWRAGVRFAVIDSRPSPPGLDALQRECPGTEVILGEFPAQRLLEAGRLVVSPGIALTEPALAEAIALGVPICGDIDLFCAEARAPVVGITGSNAKSTVTELLGRMARRAGVGVAVGGNLGTPALDLLLEGVELYVLELSSFQLERAGLLALEVATVLNISDDHLDRHGSLESYAAAKQRIFAGCAHLVFNRDDPQTLPREPELPPAISYGLSEPVENGFGLLARDSEEWLSFQGELLMPVREVALVGRHNLCNALAALALGFSVQLSMPAMLAELREFGGLAHRCQLLGTAAGVRYINDSKATNPGATLAALSGLGESNNIVLIAGGQGKGAEFSVLTEQVARYCKAVILLGEDAPRLAAVLSDAVPVHQVTSMDGAVALAADLARAGDVVLLSPACASFDMFTGFAHRGQCFADSVAAMLDRGCPA